MAGEDHLDKETSVSAEIRPTGVTAKAKSRFVAAVDRLGGNAVEFVNVRLEAGNSRRRAVIDGEKQLIEAATRYGIERMEKDPAFVDRALQSHFKGIFSRQENKDGVLQHAIEQLQIEPPTEDDSRAGSDEVSGEFLERFESYANEASSEALREKWGRVLAAEIRKPGRISRKALRAVDEMDPRTAQIFEELCKHHLGGVLPKCLAGELDFGTVTRLTEAELIVDPGDTGLVRFFSEDTIGGRQLWVVPFKGLYVAFPTKTDLSALKTGPFERQKTEISVQDGVPVLPIHVLTDVGKAVATILPKVELDALARLVTRLGSALPSGTELIKFRAGPENQIIYL